MKCAAYIWLKTSTDKNLTPVIILSCHTLGLGLIRCLGIMGVPIVAVYYNIHDMKYVTESIFVPYPEKNEKEFLDLLEKLSCRYNGR